MRAVFRGGEPGARRNEKPASNDNPISQHSLHLLVPPIPRLAEYLQTKPCFGGGQPRARRHEKPVGGNRRHPLVPPVAQLGESHIETLVLYKLNSRKFTAHNDIH